MTDYISRDNGKIAAWEILENMGYSSKHNDRLVEEVDAVFDDIPAADVRPVVFCKNCIHSVQGKKSLECEKHRYVWNNMNRWVNDEDFCCWGAKREES